MKFTFCKVQWFNSLLPRDAIWQHWFGSTSTMDLVMACCLTAPSHYPNQCWLKWRSLPFILWRVISPRAQWVNAESYRHFFQVTEDGQNTILLQMEDDGETMEVVQQPQIIDDSPRRTRGRPTKQHQIQLQFEVGGGRSQTWRPELNGWHFAYNVFQLNMLEWKVFSLG